MSDKVFITNHDEALDQIGSMLKSGDQEAFPKLVSGCIKLGEDIGIIKY